ncbi:MAG TPA: hypothetical protein VHP61_01695 [Acidobacteriota bacterium]|nr:hypothetical protein [Acidobacteriota bacterium]
MNTKRSLFLATGLVLVLAVTACTRNDVDQPSPVGPSTLATILKISANPNVLNAGTHRQSALITVNLTKYDGTPLSGRTVYFEINDAADKRANIGFFEGRLSTPSRVTDGGGNAYITYYAPLKTEIRANLIVHIWAELPGDERIFLEERTEILILR